MTNNAQLIQEAKRLILVDRISNELVIAMLSRVVDALESAQRVLDGEHELIELIKLSGHLASETMIFRGDSYPVKAIPYSRFLDMLAGLQQVPHD